MTYADEQIKQFKKEYFKVRQGLQDLMLNTVVAGQRNVSMEMRHRVVEISVARQPPVGRLSHRTVG